MVSDKIGSDQGGKGPKMRDHGKQGLLDFFSEIRTRVLAPLYGIH